MSTKPPSPLARGCCSRLTMLRFVALVLVAFSAYAVANRVSNSLTTHRMLHDAHMDASYVSQRSLQQSEPKTSGQLNCTPPRTSADAKVPFCSVPETVSNEAKRFLSTTAAGKLFGAVSYGTTPEEAAAAVNTLQNYFGAATASLAKAAEAQYMQSTRNSSIAGVPVLFAVPKGVKEAPPADTKVLLYIHGGGYTIGSCSSQLATPAATAAAGGLTIICPEYRLAPENPFPAGLNDVLSVYKALINKEGYKASNVVVLGDSAGGGMAAAVAIQLQREGVALPAGLGMFSPWADMRNRGDTIQTLLGVDPLLTELAGNARAYLGPNLTSIDDPLASPIEADFASLFPKGSLPPTLIQVGTREILLSDAVRLYHRMGAAAPAPGYVVASPYEGMWHVFQSFINVPEAQAASKEMADHFTRALKGDICK